MKKNHWYIKWETSGGSNSKSSHTHVFYSILSQV